MTMRGLFLLPLVVAAAWLPFDAGARRLADPRPAETGPMPLIAFADFPAGGPLRGSRPQAPGLPPSIVDEALFHGAGRDGSRDLAAGPGPAVLAQAATAPASPAPGELLRDCPDCPELVVVPPGEFEMGGDNPFEKPAHRVTIARAYAIGRREITFAQWDQCALAGACKHRPDDHGWGRAEQPVINVSWEDTKLYLAWLSQKTGQRYRLPTEAEWEYAARAGTVAAYWWGRDAGTGFANCDNCLAPPRRQSIAVGSFRPNGFGLYDTSGNAAEWVEDCWNDNYRNAPKDGSAWLAGDCRLRVLRGGAFTSKAAEVKSGSRFRYDLDVRYYANGFRVLRELK